MPYSPRAINGIWVSCDIINTYIMKIKLRTTDYYRKIIRWNRKTKYFFVQYEKYLLIIKY